MLREKVVKLSNNVVEIESSTSSKNKFEEKCRRLSEGKNEEKVESYA